MKISVRDMTLIALFTCLTIIGGLFKISLLAIPFTLQSLVVLLAGILLGARRAILSQVLYLLLGLIGLPVFATGGGLAYVLSPSFGFLLGMLAASGLVGFICDRCDPTREQLKIWQVLPANLAGQLLVYLFGVAYLYLIKNFYSGQSMTLLSAVELGMIPFLLVDTLKSLLAAIVGPRLRRLTRQFVLPTGTTPADSSSNSKGVDEI